jgi:hypothetical protein
VVPNGDSQPIEIAKVIIDEPDPFYDPQESLNPKSNSGFAAFTRIHYPRSAAFILREPAEVPAGAKLRLELSNKVQALGAFPLVSRRGHLAVSFDRSLTDLLSDPTVNEQRERLSALKRKRKDIASTPIPIMQERAQRFARPSNVFVRGLFLNKGEEVTPGTPASLPPLPGNVAHDRLALAKWLVGEDNPLTARVAVNRIWARLFGIGIVATEEDFGSSGERLVFKPSTRIDSSRSFESLSCLGRIDRAPWFAPTWKSVTRKIVCSGEALDTACPPKWCVIKRWPCPDC